MRAARVSRTASGFCGAEAFVQRAGRESTGTRDISAILEGGEVSIPAAGLDEPRFQHGPGGIHDHVLPGNRKFVEGDTISRRSEGGGGSSRDGGEGEGADAFRFALTRQEFLDLCMDDLEFPDMAKRRPADVEHEGVWRAGYAVSGSLANIAVARTMRLAIARRCAARHHVLLRRCT